jgi:hypothetical protein
MLFWVVTPCRLVGRASLSENYTVSLSLEDGDGMFVLNVDVSCKSTRRINPEHLHTIAVRCLVRSVVRLFEFDDGT